MYPVTFILHVHSGFAGSSDDAWLKKQTTMWFPPYKGLTVQIGNLSILVDDDVETRILNGEVVEKTEKVEIIWDVKKKEFRVYLPSDKTLYYKALTESNRMLSARYPEQFSKILEEYVNEGWDIYKIGT